MSKEMANSDLNLEKEILAPYAHITQVNGDGFFEKIIRTFNHWLRVPEDKVGHIIDITNVLLHATLILDDVQDDTNIRRGLPAAHCVYGMPLAVNCSIQLMFASLTKLSSMPLMAYKLFAENFLGVIRGQGIEIYWRDNFVCPTEEEYKKMVEHKTGRLFLVSASLLQLLSETNIDISQFVLQLGSYFQIRDDYCNFVQQEVDEELSFCEDLTEGKFTLPIIHALNTPVRNEVLNIIRRRPRDIQLKKHCVTLLEKAGSMKYTRETLRKCDLAIRAEIARLGGNPELETVLDELINWK